MTMRKLLLVAAIFMITGALVPSAAYPQAAVEYGMAASKSTAAASRASSSMRSSVKSIPRQPAARGKLVIPPLATKNLQTVMNENREKLEAESKKGGGTVQIESVPDKATIAVDGAPVGQSPAELMLPAGKHLIELTHPRFDPWYMEVTINAQESTSVTAQLERKYKSTVTLSFK